MNPDKNNDETKVTNVPVCYKSILVCVALKILVLVSSLATAR